MEGLHHTNRVEMVVVDARPPGHRPKGSVMGRTNSERLTQVGCVRIHNGTLAGGARGGKQITIERTRCWNFRSGSAGRAIRDLQLPS